jgi:hypothetical protein
MAFEVDSRHWGEVVSEKDRNAQTLAEWLASQNAPHFTYAAQLAGAR